MSSTSGQKRVDNRPRIYCRPRYTTSLRRRLANPEDFITLADIIEEITDQYQSILPVEEVDRLVRLAFHRIMEHVVDGKCVYVDQFGKFSAKTKLLPDRHSMYLPGETYRERLGESKNKVTFAALDFWDFLLNDFEFWTRQSKFKQWRHGSVNKFFKVKGEYLKTDPYNRFMYRTNEYEDEENILHNGRKASSAIRNYRQRYQIAKKNPERNSKIR